MVTYARQTAGKLAASTSLSGKSIVITVYGIRN
jgi:hypothetical protein